jgi:hypothetical protein
MNNRIQLRKKAKYEARRDAYIQKYGNDFGLTSGPAYNRLVKNNEKFENLENLSLPGGNLDTKINNAYSDTKVTNLNNKSQKIWHRALKTSEKILKIQDIHLMRINKWNSKIDSLGILEDLPPE